MPSFVWLILWKEGGNMKIIEPYFKFIEEPDGQKTLEKIEKIARVCYKSEDKICPGSAEKMVKSLIKNGHFAMLEHDSMSIKIVCDRGVSHELVRHRIASFAQESTRYCNYSDKKFDGEITVVKPYSLEQGSKEYLVWKHACEECEQHYFELLKIGVKPEIARAVLPNSLKTEVVMTANMREWRHFFELRACGKTGKTHSDTCKICCKILATCKKFFIILFDDLNGIYEN